MDNVIKFPSRNVDKDIATVHGIINTSKDPAIIGRAYIILARLEYIKMAIFNGTNDSGYYSDSESETKVVFLKVS